MIIILIVQGVIHLSAQNDTLEKRPDFISISYFTGQFQVHSAKLEKYRGTQIRGIELEMSRLFQSPGVHEMSGTKVKLGWAFNYTDYGHQDWDYGLSTQFYIEPFFKCSDRWWLSGRGGIGISYLSHPYHSETNPDNLAYCTHFSFPLNLAFSSYYLFRPRWSIKGSLTFQHISNGGIKQPNLGINYPTFVLGFEYALQDYRLKKYDKPKSYIKTKGVDILLSYSLKEDTTHVNNTNVITVFAQRAWQVSRINALSLGTLIEYQQMHAKEDDPWSLGCLAGNEFLMGQFLFGQQMGIYVLKGTNARTKLFQNYYLRYKTNSRIMAGVNFKAHGHVADYLCFQLGYAF